MLKAVVRYHDIKAATHFRINALLERNTPVFIKVSLAVFDRLAEGHAVRVNPGDCSMELVRKREALISRAAAKIRNLFSRYKFCDVGVCGPQMIDAVARADIADLQRIVSPARALR